MVGRLLFRPTIASVVEILSCCAFVCFATGCGSFGARAMKGERIQLNSAFQQTTDEQLLLNLVRLRYRDTPAFLEVSSISSQSRFEATIEAGAELERAKENLDLFTFGAGAGYATQPTLTYTPLQGDAFIQRLLTPLTLEKLMLLYQSGWNVKRVFLLGVQSMNNVKNAPRSSGPTPGRAPEYRDFLRAVEILHDLERRGLVDMGYESQPGDSASPRLILQIDPKASNLPPVTELTQILNLDLSRTSFPIVYSQVQHIRPQAVESIRIDTRSLLGIMYYLSQAVEAPAADMQKGRITVTRTEMGEPFDWDVLLGGIFKIKAESSQPAEAAVAVRYREQWFYIDDSDLDSKSTFAMLSQIFSLQAGKAEGIVPVLTLPVGR